MDQLLFHTTCTTCRARLAVRNETAIGAILECPKCGSFVEVVPPDGWQPPAAPPPEPPPPEPPPVEATAAPIQPAQPPGELDPSRPPVVAAAVMLATTAEAPAAPPPAAPAVPPLLPVDTAAPMWIKAMVYSAFPAAVLMMATGGWIASSWKTSVTPEPEPAPIAVAPPVDAPSVPPVAPPTAAAASIERRWLPDDTAVVASFVPGPLGAPSASGRLLDQFEPVWQQTLTPALKSLRLRLDDTRRVTLAVADLSSWPRACVLVLQLREGQDAKQLATLGQSAGFSLAGVDCRRFASGEWPHPWAIVDSQTIVTGEERLLRALAARGEPKHSGAIERLLKHTAEGDVTVLVDLGAARAAQWTLPDGWFDVWPTGMAPWRTFWELPEGAGATLAWGDHFQGRLLLACDTSSTAEKVAEAGNQWQPVAKAGVAGLRASLGAKLTAGEVNARAAGTYDALLAEAAQAVDGMLVRVDDSTVIVETDATLATAAVATLVVESRATIQADWLGAARTVDEAIHARILGSLMAYQKAEGEWPRGALGGALLPPETRLSWIAGVLPYLGHAEWHRKLEPGVAWNGPQNRPVTRLNLPEMINPLFGPSTTEAGFPVTHYVGVAGLGSDAGSLPADDPRAGMFGYSRATRPQDIRDGASNTIAILGVRERFGPWAAGGHPTVRGLTQAPYVNGPDGFGSGQPNGMLAGMADGSVRFLSKDVDPRLIEQLATINGREEVNLAALDPTPAPAEAPKPAEPPAAPVVPPVVDPETLRPAPEASRLTRAGVVERLGTRVSRAEWSGVPLARVLEGLSMMSIVPIALDCDAIEELGIAAAEPVTLTVERASLGEVLDELAKSLGLVCLREEGYAVLTSPTEHRQSLRPWEHRVNDLASAAEIVPLVERFVVPAAWQPDGGAGKLSLEQGVLKAEQSQAVWQRTVFFIERLRAARGKPLQTELDPELVSLTSRAQRARPMLGRTVTANFRSPVPLGEIVMYLEDSSQCRLLVDWPALSAAGLGLPAPATLAVDRQPLGVALRELLTPLGLTIRLVDAETLQITTSKALAGRLEAEFYRLPQAAQTADALPALLGRIRQEVAPSSWRDAGGAGQLYFDPPSQCLIVLQTQSGQIAVERLLSAR